MDQTIGLKAWNVGGTSEELDAITSSYCGLIKLVLRANVT